MVFNKIKQKFFSNEFPDKWSCTGGKNGHPWHPETRQYVGQKCPECGSEYKDSALDSISSEKEPKSNEGIILLLALTLLNIGSGWTTIKGATQIFPVFGSIAGGTVQALLFLIVSGLEPKIQQRPLLKWLLITSFSTLSIYTSFFAYYEYSTREGRRQESLERATSAHNNLVLEIYTPIKSKVNELASEIKTTEIDIQEEIENKKGTGEGCGVRCRSYIEKRDLLRTKYNKLLVIKEDLQPLFEYQTEGKSQEAIFKEDIQAIGKVTKNCLPEDPNFDCLPQKYENILNPNSSEYNLLRNKYIDKDSSNILLQPYHKIKKGEPDAVAAGILAILLDGAIITMGIFLKDLPSKKSKKDRLTLNISGKGSDFLEELLHQIDSKNLMINYHNSPKEGLQSTTNEKTYKTLLENINVNSNWVENNNEHSNSDAHWRITSDSNSRKLRNWIIKERERLIKEESKNKSTTNSSSSELQEVVFLLPSSQDFGLE